MNNKNKLIKKFFTVIDSLKKYIEYIFSNKKIFYIGGYPNIQNLGDVALFAAYKKMFPEYRLIHFRGGRLESFLFSRAKNIYGILGGGTLINRLCLYEFQSASKIFKKIFVLGTGVAIKSFWHNKKNWTDEIDHWRQLLKESPCLAVRGPLSCLELQRAGLNDVTIFGDPVIYLSRTKENNRISSKKIGINVGKSLGNVLGGEDSLYQKFEKLVNHLVEIGFEIEWYVVCPEDLEITKAIALKTNTPNIFFEYCNYEKFYKQSENLGFFIGLKLHAVVLALCNHIPSFMIEYQPKCRDFMMSIDLEKYCMPADQFNVDEIVNVASKIFSKELNQDHGFKKIQDIKNMQEKMIVEIKEALG